MGKFVLNPVNMEELSVSNGGESSGATTLLSFKHFLHEAQGEDVYLLLVAEQIDGITVPKDAQGLLQEFFHVSPQELLSVVPPMRDIQHRIDLVLGASFPNHLAYHMNPTDHAGPLRYRPRRAIKI
jgi:hypothetical protein